MYDNGLILSGLMRALPWTPIVIVAFLIAVAFVALHFMKADDEDM